MPDNHQDGMTETERTNVEELAAPRARIIYEVVRREGDEELRRPIGSLFWSGLAAGITIMSSVVGQAALLRKLPPGLPGRQVISDVGYSLGFLMVILGRMQLFTEQTIVTVLPNMAEPGWKKLVATARLWAVVLLGNLLGTSLAAAISIYVDLLGRDMTGAMLQVSGTLMHRTWQETLFGSIPAGFLMASVAWIRAGVSDGEFWVILVLTYAISLGDFAHVVAGSAETFLLLFAGQTGVGHAFGGILLPVLIGNIVGGTGLFALLSHAQIRREM